MKVHQIPCRPSEEAALAGLELQHDLHLALGDWASWEAVAKLLQGAGAEVQNLQLSRQGGGFSVRCRLKSVSPQSARTLTATLLDSGLAHRASVEHLVLAKNAVGEAALSLRRPSTQDADDIAIPIPADFRLASGDVLEDKHVNARRFGRRDGPQIVALGGISAGRDVCGAAGWWRGTLIGGGGVDLDRYGLIGFDFAPVCDQRVRITPHDQARLIDIALDSLGVDHLHAFLGASYGGMVGLAFAQLAPRRLGRLCVISAAHKPSAQSLAWRGVQRRVVEFGLEHGDGGGGLSLARQLAMITYRTSAEFDARFGAGVDAQGRGEVDRYLEARGAAYSEAMLPRRWLSLSEAIDRFAIDPAGIETPTSVVACSDDQLVPIADLRALADTLPRLNTFHVLPSLYGHDAFLKEPERLGPFISQFLQEPAHG